MPTNQEILTKAIQKAIAGGWKHRNGWAYLANYKNKAPFNSVQFADETGEVWHMPIEALIFNHDFAKALWGELPLKSYRWHSALARDDTEDLLESGVKENWQYHLQLMVIAEDPIKYLGEHL